MIITRKFGGTSMGTSESIRQVANIIRSENQPQAIIVSAVSQTTDSLNEIYQASISQESSQISQLPQVQQIQENHNQIIQELSINLNLSGTYNQIISTAQTISSTTNPPQHLQDQLLGYGEIMSSAILASYLTQNGYSSLQVNSKRLIQTDNNYGEGTVNTEISNQQIRAQLLPLIESQVTPIITGFIAESEEGNTILLGRGGSDYSASLIAAALNSDRLEIWTDVNGIYNSDPRHLPEAEVIPELSFLEAAELSYFGAKVLHPKTITPAIHQNIPVIVKNTFNPEHPGTTINQKESHEIKAIAWRDNATIMNICSTRMLEAHGFLAQIFNLFANHRIDVDVLATSEVSVSLTINNHPPEELITELSQFSSVSVYKDYSILCLVGGGMITMKGVLAKLFNSLKDHSIKMVSQGASQRNITFLVKTSERQEVAQKIFTQFFNQNNSLTHNHEHRNYRIWSHGPANQTTS